MQTVLSILDTMLRILSTFKIYMWVKCIRTEVIPAHSKGWYTCFQTYPAISTYTGALKIQVFRTSLQFWVTWGYWANSNFWFLCEMLCAKKGRPKISDGMQKLGNTYLKNESEQHIIDPQKSSAADKPFQVCLTTHFLNLFGHRLIPFGLTFPCPSPVNVPMNTTY